MIKLYCERGDGDKEMNEVSSDFITSDLVAVKRGTYEIDKQYYLVYEQSIQIPWKKTFDSMPLMPDDIVEISDSLLGIDGRRKISNITISGNNSDISISLELEKYEEYI